MPLIVQRCSAFVQKPVCAIKTSRRGSCGGDIDRVEVTNNEGRFSILKADAYVLSLGSYRPILADQVGVSLNIYPAKGLLSKALDLIPQQANVRDLSVIK